jgi:peptidoglycan hydrolase-like protein with peptidoglycan-binding domain
MATKFLRKIILEELKKVLKEDTFGVDTPFGSSQTMSMGGPPTNPKPSRPAGDPKVKKLQSLLTSAGYNVGKVDGIPGPLLFKALSDANKDMSGVGVPPERIAKDFRSAGSSAADDFISMFSDPTQVASLRKGNVKKVVDKTMAPIDAAMGKQAPSDTGVTKPVKPETQSPGSSIDRTPMGKKSFGPRDPSITKDLGKPKEEEPVNPKLGGLEEAVARELRKLMRNI